MPKFITISDISETNDWMIAQGINDIECVVPDFAGISRGKSMPRTKFIDSMKAGGLRVPETLFSMTINGDFVYNQYIAEMDRDILLIPDLTTMCTTPWRPEPTALVICDAYYEDGKPVPFNPRQVLKSVVDSYQKKGWEPIVAPEFEFYLLSKEEGIKGKPVPPIGQSGRRAGFNNPYSVDALDEFASYFDEVYDSCDAQNINVDTLIHEAGPAQFELNVLHGKALNVADQAFLFKRIIRQVAIRHGLFASFMASPYSGTFGSSMHLHQSIKSSAGGDNIFVTKEGKDTESFMHHIGGLQHYLPQSLPLFAPYVNSYRRFGSGWSCPTNTHWGRENRSVGLRVPGGDNPSRRIENRIAGSDVNPYLAIAASLACGLLGMEKKIDPTSACTTSAYEEQDGSLPAHFLDGLRAFRQCEDMKNILSPEFVDTFSAVKELEYTSYSSVLSPWETENLMLTV